MSADFGIDAALPKLGSPAWPARHVAARAALRAQRMRVALRGWWQRLWMDERTAYLSQAKSHAELEYRIGARNDGDRHRRMPLM